MSCSCKNKNVILSSVISSNVIQTAEEKTKPFEICPLCAFKHISYSLMLFPTEKERSIANAFLAYKHLEKQFKEEATLCFDLITKFLNNTLVINDFYNVIEKLQQLAVTQSEKDEVFSENLENLNLEKNLENLQQCFLCIISAGELYNNEFGYKDVNTSYVIGLLQLAIEKEYFDTWKKRIREIWKKIESGENVENYFVEISKNILNRNACIKKQENAEECIEKIKKITNV